MEAEIRVMLPLTKQCLEPLESRKGKGVHFPRALVRSTALPTL